MDPNESLATLRAELSGDWDADTLHVVASYFQALDTWLTRGGFLPSAWERKR